MTAEQRLKNLSVPKERVDVVLDTDAYNEIDDQFAIAYLLRSSEKLNTVAIYAAPFHNRNSDGPADGMGKSYDEILKLLKLLNAELPVFKGSDRFLPSESEPVISPAALDLAKRAENYSPENPLYVVAIGAITNIASAILINPRVAENTVVIWLGGHSLEYHDTAEFNMVQDIASARVVYKSGVPYVQLPCFGVVSEFRISKPELEYWLIGKNPIADYLARNTINTAEKYASGNPWTRVIWDVTAVAWLLNDNDRFMLSRVIDSPLPAYDKTYEKNPEPQKMRYVYYIKRDSLMKDLIQKILNQ
ncbi:MAG: nucleoside hydrolase [Ruminococcaceae bacterium]|nr:nucleoside hydrolase [Oscillospiraceae bacterium]